MNDPPGLFGSFPTRKECPPGACTCNRESLRDAPESELRILMLTKEEEKKLVARIEKISTYAELLYVAERMQEQLGIAMRIAPGANEVRTIRGIQIQLEERPGLCRKTHQSIPAAVRRCLDRHPGIAYAILDAHDLLGSKG